MQDRKMQERKLTGWWKVIDLENDGPKSVDGKCTIWKMTVLCVLEFDGLENAGLEIDRLTFRMTCVVAELNAAQTNG